MGTVCVIVSKLTEICYHEDHAGESKPMQKNVTLRSVDVMTASEAASVGGIASHLRCQPLADGRCAAYDCTNQTKSHSGRVKV